MPVQFPAQPSNITLVSVTAAVQDENTTDTTYTIVLSWNVFLSQEAYNISITTVDDTKIYNADITVDNESTDGESSSYSNRPYYHTISGLNLSPDTDYYMTLKTCSFNIHGQINYGLNHTPIVFSILFENPITLRNPPTELVATGGKGEVHLRWLDGQEVNNTYVITCYHSTDGDNYIKLDNPQVIYTGMSAIVTDLTDNMELVFVVYSIDELDNASATSEASSSVYTFHVPYPVLMSVDFLNESSIKIRFQKVTPGQFSGGIGIEVTGYRIEVDCDTYNSPMIIDITDHDLTPNLHQSYIHTINNLEQKKIYKIVVIATNMYGDSDKTKSKSVMLFSPADTENIINNPLNSIPSNATVKGTHSLGQNVIELTDYQGLRYGMVIQIGDDSTKYIIVGAGSLILHIPLTQMVQNDAKIVVIDSNTARSLPTIVESVINNICFPEKTPVLTDQGIIHIDKLNPSIHTINKKTIVGITKSISTDKYLICFEKDSLEINVPRCRTVVSQDHKISHNGVLKEAKKFINIFNRNIKRVKYDGQVLYNVLMEKYDTMNVNNLIVETLHPNNAIAKLYNETFSEQERNNLIIDMNKCVRTRDKNGYNKIVTSMSAKK